VSTNGELYVVHVRDHINPQLAGHDGCDYSSPPQLHEQALELIALLLSCPGHLVSDGRSEWTTSVAGGRRAITLTAA
jgi:hypothetical protein